MNAVIIPIHRKTMKKITIKTLIDADIDKVWTAWTDAEHVVNWNFASDDWHCPHAESDLKTGGSFKYTMAAKDGSVSFDFDGRYTMLIEKQHISILLGDNRRVELDFHSLPNHTTHLTETFETENVNPEAIQRQGWQAILNNFKKYVEHNMK